MTKFPPNFVNMKNVNLSLHVSSRRGKTVCRQSPSVSSRRGKTVCRQSPSERVHYNIFQLLLYIYIYIYIYIFIYIYIYLYISGLARPQGTPPNIKNTSKFISEHSHSTWPARTLICQNRYFLANFW